MSPKKFRSKQIAPDDEGMASAQVPNTVQEVEQVYDDLKTIERPKKESFVSRPLVSALIGVCAGVVGALLVLGDTFGLMSRLVNAGNGKDGRTIILERRERLDVPWEESKEKVFERAAGVLHGVYRLKKQAEGGGDLTKDAYFAEDQTGVAVAVTADGWLVSVKKTVADSKGSYGVMAGGRVYAIEKIVSDPFSDVLFLKTALEQLTPVRFSSKSPDLGTIAVTGSLMGGEFRGELTGLVSLDVRPVSTKNPLESSERLSSLLSFGLDAGGRPGTGAFNVSGELLGIADGTVGFIPARRITSILPQVLKEGKVTGTLLGVSTLDVGYVGVDQKKPLIPLQGALVVKIATNSPASKAKLQGGDVIVKVEGESVGMGRPLAEMIQEYPAGTKVKLEILRNADTVDVEVTLEKL